MVAGVPVDAVEALRNSVGLDTCEPGLVCEIFSTHD